MVLVVTIRSFVYFALVTFVAQYYIEVLGSSPAFANAALSVMLFAGAFGTLTLGPLADRIGRRPVLAGSMLLLSPLLYAFTLSGSLPGIVFLALVGAATIGTFGVTVVMGQEYLPGRIGVAAGVTLGLSIGIGGLGAPIFGAVADSFGLPTMMLALATLPLVGLALALSLPRKPKEPTRFGA
jgi:FSR family fosmidomycin resistance protein-like MFS transporter